MRIRVCSGFSPKGRLQYGERFLRTFDARWPSSVELQVYVEEPTKMPRDAERSLWDIPGAIEFNTRHRINYCYHGLIAQPCWKQREVQRGYSFKTDAYKFWKQIMIPEAAAQGLDDGDVLVWLDGDVETTSAVPECFVSEMLGHAEVSFLGRQNSHSEIGFWAIRLNPRTRQFLTAIADMYRSDNFRHLPEWHSAFIWDHVRQTFGLEERNLVRPGLRGHVWPHTPLDRHLRHDKGGRKPR